MILWAIIFVSLSFWATFLGAVGFAEVGTCKFLGGRVITPTRGGSCHWVVRKPSVMANLPQSANAATSPLRASLFVFPLLHVFWPSEQLPFCAA